MQISRTSIYNKNFASNKSKTAVINFASHFSDGDTYEHTSIDSFQSPTYKINKMTFQDREALVNQMKQEQATKESQFFNIVQDSINQQIDKNNFWKLIAEGKVSVNEEARQKLEEDLDEDGYWGVKKTSQRLFDFASALAGDDVDKMKDMQKAMMKGFDEATKTWTKDLPDISTKTIDAANQLFDEYFKSKEA